MSHKRNLITAMLCVSFTLSLHSQCFELAWSEEFDSTGLPSPGTWTFETGGHGWGNNELQYYTADSANAYVDEGKLVITAREESYGGRSYTSARMITKDKVEFQYGRVEARMRLPYGQGIWPAFWLMGSNIDEASWPACGEIDIMEMVGGGEGDRTVHGTNHWDGGGFHASYGQSYVLDQGMFADSFHIFTMEWSPESTRWYVDGEEFNVMSITDESLSEFHQPFFILLNLAVGGNWPGSPDAGTVFPQTLEVDYIRVYKKLDNLEMEGPETAGEKQAGLEFRLPQMDSVSYSWTVPEDAQIVSGQDSTALLVNWGCGAGQVSCTVSSDCGSSEITHEVALENRLSGPMFLDPGEMDVLFHFHEMWEGSYDWMVPGDASITEGQGSDSIRVDWGSSFDAVVLSTENSCGTRQYSHEVLASGSYPYPDPHSPWPLPGNIMATDYNYGGEGVAYHDLSAWNEGDGPRQDEHVDTQYSDNDTPNLGWILNGEWVEYSIRIDSSWMYNVSVRVASQNASGGPFSLWVNGEERLGGIEVQGTGAWDKFITLRPGSIFLHETDTLLRVQFDRGGFNLGRMNFSLAASNDLPQKIPTDHFLVYPNPADLYLQVRGVMPNSEYRIHDLSGRICLRGRMDAKSSTLLIESLEPGSYLFQGTDATGQTRTNLFLKR